MNLEKTVEYAGFWRRFVALVIDVFVVSLIVFPFALIIGLVSPDLLLVETPFGLFTTTEITRESPENEERNDDGSTSVVQVHVERDNVLGLWENYYEIHTTRSGGKSESSRYLIDSETELRITRTTSSGIEFYVIFIYWILLESSVWQGSVGKKAMGIKVETREGGKPGIFQAIARNLLKLLSGTILFIGFMMAGWTSRKQALHDIIPGMLVVKDPS